MPARRRAAIAGCRSDVTASVTEASATARSTAAATDARRSAGAVRVTFGRLIDAACTPRGASRKAAALQMRCGPPEPQRRLHDRGAAACRPDREAVAVAEKEHAS